MSSDSTSSPSNLQLINLCTKETFSCSICTEWLLPTVHGCQHGHYLCSLCLVQWGKSRCPQCRSKITKNEGISRMFEQAEFKIPCRYNTQGCKEVFTPSQVTLHMQGCKYRAVACKLSIFCNTMFPLDEILYHWKQKHAFDAKGPSTCLEKGISKEFSYFLNAHDEENHLPTINLNYNEQALYLCASAGMTEVSFWLASLETEDYVPSVSCTIELEGSNPETKVRFSLLFSKQRVLGIRSISCPQRTDFDYVAVHERHLNSEERNGYFLDGMKIVVKITIE